MRVHVREHCDWKGSLHCKSRSLHRDKHGHVAVHEKH